MLDQQNGQKSNICIGLTAHVDAGKTTLSEAMLYASGAIRSFGRVDRGNAFLDSHRLEKERGITIFSKQAVFELPGLRVFLLDTPGHADLSSETERTLSVLDYAVLVISGTDGVQAHTQTLWKLLRRLRIPTFVWINKMDICLRSRGDIISGLERELGSGFFDFSAFGAKEDVAEREALLEALASIDESAMEEYFSSGTLCEASMRRLIKKRELFPCFFGSALKQEGVAEFLNALSRLAEAPSYPDEFSARVFKISRDGRGERLSWIKLTGGALRTRDIINGEKVTQIRFYSGARSASADEARAGAVCAVTGLSRSYAGQGLGAAHDSAAPLLRPVLTYAVHLPEDIASAAAYPKLKMLCEEDPMLNIVWDHGLREIQAQLMGPVQIDVLKQIIKERFDLDVQIDAGKIMYRETIAHPVEGAGHFEPLRHYAEVHLLMEPLPAGTGLIFESACSTDTLEINWQNLILSELREKEHTGVLTGSPVTDIKITLVAGRAHLRHSEGGDFRQAACRALRQGLMKAQNVLLEPWNDFVIHIPADQLGRAISDLKAMSAVFSAPEDLGGAFRLTGRGPVSEMDLYQTELMSYSRGKGSISFSFAGYYPCHDTEKVIRDMGYEAERDVENTADSIFCSRGEGVNVKWDKAGEFMHIDSGIRISNGRVSEAEAPKIAPDIGDIDEKELEAIMLREFGPIKRPKYSVVSYDYDRDKRQSPEIKKEYYIIDGYNVIFSWDELNKLAQSSIASARDRLTAYLGNFASYRGCQTVLVFDGYKLKDNPGTRDGEPGIRIVYTREHETADRYIEKLIRDIGKNYSVRVVSSDGLIQLAALRLGVIRMSSRELQDEVQAALDEIREIIDRQGHYRNSLGELIKRPELL